MAESKFMPKVEDLPGDFFDLFQLQRGPVLGRGMTGEVVAAIYNRPNQPPITLACKKYTRLTPDGEMKNMARFSREIFITQQISHPNLVKHIWSARCPEYFIMCTAACTRGNLSSNLLKMTPGVCGLYFTQLACAVRYLNHKMRIIHSDIKPGNIFINASGDAVLGDFGGSFSVAPDKVLVLNSKLIGTVGFMAPELKTSKEIDPFKLDVYSLAVVLWSMVFKTEPKGNTTHPYLQILQSVPNVPEPFRWCMEWMLNANPALRPRILEVLDKLLSENFYLHLINTL